MSESVKRDSDRSLSHPSHAGITDTFPSRPGALAPGDAASVKGSTGAQRLGDRVVEDDPAVAAGTAHGPVGIGPPLPDRVSLDRDTMAGAQAFANGIDALVEGFCHEVSGPQPVSHDKASAALCHAAVRLSSRDSFVDIPLMVARILSEASEARKEDDERAARVQKAVLKREMRRAARKEERLDYDTALKVAPSLDPAVGSSTYGAGAVHALQRAKDDAVGAIRMLLDHRRAGELGRVGSGS